MTKHWHIRDVIDLEYFLHPDSAHAANTDRDIYLAYTGRHPGPPERRALFKYWLEARRQQEAAREQDPVLPGTLYRETLSASAMILCALLLAAGAGLAWSLLSYSGRTPVNVFTCLWVLLAPQVLLLLILLASSGFSRISGGLRVRYPLISLLFRRMSNRILRYAARNLSKERANRLQAALGRVGQARTVYGGIFFWPVFNTAQAAGVCFNIGIIAALLLRITITDVAFGWQSTLQPDPQTVYRIVEWIAAPWAWFTPEPIAHPSAAQIAGSKMVLKEGMVHLSTSALVSWWPFLCLSVVFYGLLPRAVLLAGGLWRQQRELSALQFTHAACDRLVQRMTTPRVQTGSRAYTREKTDAAAGRVLARNYSEPGLTEENLLPAIVAVPEELEIDETTLENRLRIRIGAEVACIFAVDGNPDTDADKLAQIIQARDFKGAARLVIIQESWQPPIKENLAWIRRMKQAAGPQSGAVIGLIGKPAEGGIFATPVPEAEWIIWEQAVHSLGDPYIRVEVLGEIRREQR